MSRFAILRTDKLKHLASVRRSLKHSFREQPTPNADAARLAENTHIGAASVEDAMRQVAARLPKKRRKDAVLAIEYLVTGSPEAMHGKSRAEQDAYFDDALAWLRERHGADNVVYAGIHRDERTPHMYAYVVPLDPDTGRLNCRRYLGGAKALTQLQTDFAVQVGKQHGLERGIEGSKAKHQRVQQWYRQIAADGQHVKVTPEQVTPKVKRKGWLKSERETPDEVAQRVTKQARQAYAPAVERAKTMASERRRAAEMARTAQGANKARETAQKAAAEARAGQLDAIKAKNKAEAELQAYRSIFTDGLTPDQQQKLIALAHRTQDQNKQLIEQQRQARMTPEQRAQEAREEAAFRAELARVEREEQEPQNDQGQDYEKPGF